MKNNWVILTASVMLIIIVATVALHSPKSDTLDEEAINNLPVSIGGFHQNFIWLKPGETGEIYYTLYTRNGGPANVSYGIYRVNEVYETEQIAMPDGLNVSIAPSSFIGEPHRNYTSKITINTSPELTYRGAGSTYTLYLQVDFEGENETEGGDWVRILIADDPVPGASGIYSLHGSLADENMILKAGAVGHTYYTLHTRESGIGKVRYQVYRIKNITHKYPVPDEEKLPMPEGLSVSIEPNNFIARNFEDYTSKITVKTGPELDTGEYIVCIDVTTNGMLTNDFLIINVI